MRFFIFYLITVCCYYPLYVGAQTAIPPTIMLIPYVKETEDIRTICDKDANKRFALTKAREYFDNQKFRTIDFLAKLKIIENNAAFTAENQVNIQTEIIATSGCDVYIVVDVDAKNTSSGAYSNVILSAYDAATAASLASKTGSSGKFYTEDFTKLTNRALELALSDFTQTLSTKFAEMQTEGRSLFIEISIPKTANIRLSDEIGQEEMPMSDVIENWLSQNAWKGIYHLQGTTENKMIIDEYRIPFYEANGTAYLPNKFALVFYQYLKSLGLNPQKQTKGNTIYLTLE